MNLYMFMMTPLIVGKPPLHIITVNLHFLPVTYMACLATARKPHTEAMQAKSSL